MLDNTHTREKLDAVEARQRSLRDERARLTKLLDAAKVAVAEHETDATLNAAGAAKESLKSVDQQLEAVGEEQVQLLRHLGAGPGHEGWASKLGNGWGTAARRLDLGRGVLSVDVPAGSLMAHAPLPSSGGGRPVKLETPALRAANRQILYSVFEQLPIDDGDLAVTDFSVSFLTGALTGVERAPAATSQKADLGASVTAATPAVRQFAVTQDELPKVLFDNRVALQAYLEQEARRQLDLAIDEHVLARIAAAGPATGSTGSTLIEKVRNAVAASRALGASPSVLAVNPTDAVELDLSTDGASGYVFAPRDSGSASPLWSLAIHESPAVDDPIVLDPARLGVVYTGSGSITVDPYSGMKRNVIALRIEVQCLAHIRNAISAYVIA